MSKEKEQEQEQQQAQQPAAEATTVPAESSAGIESPVILTAKTREELFTKVEQAKASVPKGKSLIAGAVGRKDSDGTYTITIEII